MTKTYIFDGRTNGARRDLIVACLRGDGFRAYLERDGDRELLCTNASVAAIALSVGSALDIACEVAGSARASQAVGRVAPVSPVNDFSKLDHSPEGRLAMVQSWE